MALVLLTLEGMNFLKGGPAYLYRPRLMCYGIPGVGVASGAVAPVGSGAFSLPPRGRKIAIYSYEYIPDICGACVKLPPVRR